MKWIGSVMGCPVEITFIRLNTHFANLYRLTLFWSDRSFIICIVLPRSMIKSRKTNPERAMDDNKKIALAVLKGAFIDRDVSVVERLFAKDYVQHNPTLPNGPPPLASMFASFPVDFKYEPGMAVADGDLVMVHGRYTGWGPKPLIAVDIFRLANGRVVEHWDVMQEEVPASQTVSGNAMFQP